MGLLIAKRKEYALLDRDLVQPVTYTNTITFKDKLNGLFPVEKSMLPQFINAIEEIENKLSSKKPFGEVKQYKFDQTKFIGRSIALASETRMNYLLNSNIDNVSFSVHLCDAKITNSANEFIIKTWIKYLKDNIK